MGNKIIFKEGVLADLPACKQQVLFLFARAAAELKKAPAAERRERIAQARGMARGSALCTALLDAVERVLSE